MLIYIGLSLVILGWVNQFFSKGKDLKVTTVLIYSIGVALLAINGLIFSGITAAGILELGSFLAAFAVLLKIRK